MPANSPSMPPIFGVHAVSLRRAGLAVLPASGKKPVRSGFNEWKHPPSIAVVAEWAEECPSANIAYITGLSRTPGSPYGVVVVDADSSTESERALEIFGPTPAMINTRRGRHFIYRAPNEPLGKIGSLRKFGFEIDIKHGQKGNGISVAPPSAHPDQTDFNYSWHECSGPEALAELPCFDIRALHALIARGSRTLPNTTYTAPPARAIEAGLSHSPRPGNFGRRFRSGSRKLGLNDHLVSHAWAIEDFETCLDIARTWNDELQDTYGQEKLSDEEVVSISRSVMADLDSGKIVRTRRHRAIAITDGDEISSLLALYRNGDAALALLLMLRTAHGERCQRGESFSLCARAMVEAHTMGSWAARKYREARDTLLHAGLIKLVSPAKRCVAAQYRLTARVLTPSLARRKT